MPKKLTTEQYIQKANKVHNNKYDYSKTIYIRTSDQITIICSEHGQFSQYPFNHLKGHGCLKCSGKCKSTTERFIENAIEAHGEGVYDYSNSVYKNAKTKLDIRCTNCNTTFSMTPSDHIHGKNGCPACAKANKGWNRSYYIEQAKSHNNKSKLYILRCCNDEEEFYKIGITMKSIKQRYPKKAAMPYKYETLLLLEGDAGQIWDLEKKLHRQFKDLSYTPKIFFYGRTQCYTELS